MATRAAIEKHAKHLMEVNPNYTKEEALDVALFDLEYTGSDAACREFLEENTRDCDISLEDAEIMFTKKKAKSRKPILTDEQKAFNAKAMENIKERRVEYLVSEIEKRPELFGTEIEYSVNAITGIAPESNLPYTIKISKHKEQKVFSKDAVEKRDYYFSKYGTEKRRLDNKRITKKEFEKRIELLKELREECKTKSEFKRKYERIY